MNLTFKKAIVVKISAIVLIAFAAVVNCIIYENAHSLVTINNASSSFSCTPSPANCIFVTPDGIVHMATNMEEGN